LQALSDVPLLSQLPRVELAKLVSDIHTLEVARGETISLTEAEATYVYLVYGGKIGLFLEVDQTPVTLMVLGAGEILGEVAPETGPLDERFIYRALEQSVVIRIEKARFQGILSQHPILLGQFSQAMVRRSSSVLDELARTKTALLLHAEEVWASLEAANEAVESLSATSATIAAPAPPGPATPLVRLKRGLPWSRQALLHHGLPVVAAVLVATVGGTNLSFSTVRAFLGILVWGVFSWLFDALPDYVVALTIGLVAMYLFLEGYFRGAFLLAALFALGWRVLSEYFRADYRGEGKFSAYQQMALWGMGYCTLLALYGNSGAGSRTDLNAGLASLWSPAPLLFFQALWLLLFIYTGVSSVTGATLTFHVRQEKI